MTKATETANPLKARILDAFELVLDEQLPQVEDAIQTTSGNLAASIAVKIGFNPDKDTGDLTLLVTGKSSIPATPTECKVRLAAGGRQLELIL